VKRIAAVAALIITMLAVPAAAAMASTTGSGSGSEHSGQVPFTCPPPYLGHHRDHNRYLRRYRHRHPRRTQVACQVPSPYPPYQQNCTSQGFAYGQAQSFTFDVASGSSTAYEVSGPTLAAGEEFTYDGSTYTIWSVNPGDDSFTMSQGGSLYVNDGSAITDATGYLAACSA
jgi:hypothetical protein